MEPGTLSMVPASPIPLVVKMKIFFKNIYSDIKSDRLYRKRGLIAQEKAQAEERQDNV